MPLRFQQMMIGVAACAALAAGSRAQMPAAAAAADGENAAARVVLTVGEARFTAEDVEQILQTLPPQTRQYYSREGRHLLPQYLVRLKVLSAEARKQKLDQQPEVRQAMEVAAESVLADAARRRIEQSLSAPDDLVAQLYEVRKKEFEEVRLRRILIRTESSLLTQSLAPAKPPLSSPEARKKLEELRQQVQSGKDFAELARANSDDVDSAPNGGDIGFVGFREMLPPVAQAADRLSAGQVSDIIPTPYGMELYQVVEKRFKPLREVRPQLEAVIRQGKLEERLQEIQSQYKITMDNEFFTPVTSGSPAPFGAPAASGPAPAGQ